MHPELRQQLAELGIDPDHPPDEQTWGALLARLTRAYDDHDTTRSLLDRTQETLTPSTKEYEHPIQRADHNAKTVFDASSEGLLLLDDTGRILQANPASAALGGLESASQIEGCALYEIFEMAEIRSAEDFSERAQQDTWRDEKAVARDGDQTRHISCSFSATRALPDQPARIVCAARDVTEQHQFAERLQDLNLATERARDEAIRASDTKSRFLANMSHELRTPLNAILGYAELLREEAIDVDATTIADLDKIHAAARHLLTLINDVLDISKIEAGRLHLRSDRIDMEALLRECHALCAPLAAANDDTLTVRIEEGIGWVHGDRMRLKQVVVNLLSNACKFTLGGHVSLVAERHVRHGTETILVRVEDDGVGMNEETLARIFRPFAQGDDSTTRLHQGTGLGLTIARRLCRMMGGDLRAQSALGEGSVFTIELGAPRSTDLDVFLQERGTLGDAAEEPIVLLVDDDPRTQEIVRRQLSGASVKLVVASDGSEGLSMARALDPDVIVLDVFMPELDGWSVLARLREDDALKAIPVIMISSQEHESPRVALGADDYLVKPIDRRQLLEVIGRFAGHLPEPKRVLIVEDSEPIREILRRSLAHEAIEVREAADGIEGIESIQAHGTPDLILLDLMMPRLDGFGFLRQLRALPDGAHVPVVVLTAKTLSMRERDVLLSNVSRVFSKNSLDHDALRSEVMALLTRRTRALGDPSQR